MAVMGFRFECPNDKCRKVILASADMAGKADRCPRCGMPIVIPRIAEGSQADLSFFRAIQRVHDRDVAAMAMSELEGKGRCLECGRYIDLHLRMCPECGRPNPFLPMPDSASARSTRRLQVVTLDGAFIRHSLESAWFAFKGAPAALRPAFLLWLLLLLGGAIRSYLAPQPWPEMTAVAWVALVLVGLPVLGFVARFYLNITVATLTGSTRMSSPAFDLILSGGAAVKLAGLLLIYFLPVVTLPLLSGGLLILAYTRDARALDLRWMARSMSRCVTDLAVLWLVIVGYLLVLLLGGWLISHLRPVLEHAFRIKAGYREVFGMGVAAVVLLVQVFWGCIVAAGIFRSIGRAAQLSPSLINTLPERADKNAVWVSLLAGLAISTGMILLLTKML